ncbi:hypothetical protein EG329_003763 [Mollisiaceae sp. DMI_Dod_QoI]|nr:hypothetical protein EG329_003763 [Helotiales sp. DMI_Dod_QoI]
MPATRKSKKLGSRVDLLQRRTQLQQRKPRDKTAPFFNNLKNTGSNCQEQPPGVRPLVIGHIASHLEESVKSVLQDLSKKAGSSVEHKILEYNTDKAACDQPFCELARRSTSLVLTKSSRMQYPTTKNQQRLQRGAAFANHLITLDDDWGAEQEFRTKVMYTVYAPGVFGMLADSKSTMEPRIIALFKQRFDMLDKNIVDAPHNATALELKARILEPLIKMAKRSVRVSHELSPIEVKCHCR